MQAYFINKTWFPSNLLFACKAIRPIEPCIKIIFALVGAIAELSSGHWTLYHNGDFVEDNIGNFAHATMFAFFGLTGITEIVLELRTFKNALSQSLSHVALCVAFVIEGILFAFHLDDDRSQLDIKAHMILYTIIFASAAAVALEGWLKPSPGAAIARAYLVTLQGTWFFEIAFALYGPNRWNKKNRASDMLIPIVFAWHVLSIFLAFFVIYLLRYLKVNKYKKHIGLALESNHLSEESQPLYKETEKAEFRMGISS